MPDETIKLIEKQQVQCKEMMAVANDLRADNRRLNNIIDNLMGIIAEAHSEILGKNVPSDCTPQR